MSLPSLDINAGVVVFSAGVNDESVFHEDEAVRLDFIRMGDHLLLLSGGKDGERVDSFPGVRGIGHTEGNQKIITPE